MSLRDVLLAEYDDCFDKAVEYLRRRWECAPGALLPINPESVTGGCGGVTFRWYIADANFRIWLGRAEGIAAALWKLGFQETAPTWDTILEVAMARAQEPAQGDYAGSSHLGDYI